MEPRRCCHIAFRVAGDLTLSCSVRGPVVRRFLTPLFILAFALRALVPAGFMLAPSAVGEMTVVLCTGHGPQTITLDADGKPVPAAPKQSQHTLCAYASVGGVALSEPVLAPAGHDITFAELSFYPGRYLFRAFEETGANSARGPPSLS